MEACGTLEARGTTKDRRYFLRHEHDERSVPWPCGTERIGDGPVADRCTRPSAITPPLAPCHEWMCDSAPYHE